MLFAIFLYFSPLTTVSVTGNISLLPGVIPDSVHAPQYSLHSFIANAIDNIVNIGFLPSTKNAKLNTTTNIPMGPIPSNGSSSVLKFAEGISSSTNYVLYNGIYYSTLSNVYVNGAKTTCQYNYITLPKNWWVASEGIDVKQVIYSYTWSTTYVVLGNGATYYTGYSNYKYPTNNLMYRTSDNSYYCTLCNCQVLIYYSPPVSNDDDASSSSPPVGAVVAIVMSVVFFCCILPAAIVFIIVRGCMMANERAVIPAPVTAPVQVQLQPPQQQFGQVYSYDPLQHDPGQVNSSGVVYALPVHYPQQQDQIQQQQDPYTQPQRMETEYQYAAAYPAYPMSDPPQSTSPYSSPPQQC